MFEDVPLFLGQIKDLFPGLECPRVGYPDFNAAVTEVLEKNGYIVLAHQVGEPSEKYRYFWILYQYNSGALNHY